MGLNPFLTFYIAKMLNFDGDVDANANANVKCEHTISVYSHGLYVEAARYEQNQRKGEGPLVEGQLPACQ